MKNWTITKDMAQDIKDHYKSGMRVEIIDMEDPYDPVPSGTRGTVAFVDDAGQIHVKWDNGSRLAIVPSVDQFRIVEGD